VYFLGLLKLILLRALNGKQYTTQNRAYMLTDVIKYPNVKLVSRLLYVTTVLLVSFYCV